MKYLRLLLYPFSLVYGAVIWCRNRLYDGGILAQTGFDLPVIVVGNLEVGGTGKSPMTEYLIRLLKDTHRVATLSRGYGRRTKGFLEVKPGMTALDVGDEPLQFKLKFPDITVAVQEDRVAGVRVLQKDHDLVLLDDAYQHRALKPGFSILLFDYNRLNDFRILLPAGNFRDNFQERKRASMMVVTKCPAHLSAEARKEIQALLQVQGRNIPIYFASIAYGEPVSYKALMRGSLSEATASTSLQPEEIQQALIVTGIARPAPFEAYVRTKVQHVEQLTFPDHHPFSIGDLNLIARKFDAIQSDRKIILTTEKDRMRLMGKEFASQINEWPIYSIPIRMTFLENDGKAFDRQVMEYCRRSSH